MALLTVKQVAQRLNVSLGTVYDLCAKRKIPHVRVGAGRGVIRIDEQALREYIEGATVRPQEPAAPTPAAEGKGPRGSRDDFPSYYANLMNVVDRKGK
jgi:excisionase family DNA binding protein